MFAVATPEVDNTPPRILHVRFNGRTYLKGDVIQPRPTITASIEDDVAVSKIEIRETSRNLYSGTLAGNWIDSTGQGRASYDSASTTFEYSLQPGNYLGSPPIRHVITIEAWDSSNNSTFETFLVQVYSGTVQVIGATLTYPVPFKPVRAPDNPLRIGYTLSKNADVDLMIYDVSGQIVMTRKFRANFEGGRAGYNIVEWNGRTDFGGVIGNGIYIYRIISGKRAIGTGKIIVFD